MAIHHFVLCEAVYGLWFLNLCTYHMICGLIFPFTYIEVSDEIATTCVSIPTGHLSMVIFPHSVNPNLFATAEPQAFISKYRIALLQFLPSMGMHLYLCVYNKFVPMYLTELKISM